MKRIENILLKALESAIDEYITLTDASDDNEIDRDAISRSRGQLDGTMYIVDAYLSAFNK